MALYDYLIVGSGLFGSVFAYEATKQGKKCLVIDRRSHIGGKCYTSETGGIQVHHYGAHIFRTSDIAIWNYILQFTQMNHFINSPLANYKGKLYNLPFNMNTFYQIWGVITPRQAKEMIASGQAEVSGAPENLEAHVIKLVGRDVYEKLVKGYTEKQWGKPCRDLPKSIIRRLPVRFTYDNNYYTDPYQGIPIGGYTQIFEHLLENCDVRLDCDYIRHRSELDGLADKIIYTGAIDEYFDYCLGALEYRSLIFETEILEEENYQGVAVMNFTDSDTPYTRIIEHKHLAFGNQKSTVISKEYPVAWAKGMEPYYPINDEKNQRLLNRYLSLSKTRRKVVFGGTLGEYQYYDMQDTIKSALQLAGKELDKKVF